MTAETRTVHFTLDPALKAYYAWIEAEGRGFSLKHYDLFAAGYRARVAETKAADPRADMPCGGAFGCGHPSTEHDTEYGCQTTTNGRLCPCEFVLSDFPVPTGATP